MNVFIVVIILKHKFYTRLSFLSSFERRECKYDGILFSGIIYGYAFLGDLYLRAQNVRIVFFFMSYDEKIGLSC